MATATYKYEGQQLSKGIMKALIVELLAGETATRKEIFEKVHEHHTKLGGKTPSAKDPEKNCGKALAELKTEQRAINTQNSGPGGSWRIFDKPAPLPKPKKAKQSSGKVKPVETLYAEPSNKESVYVYYYPAYKELAELKKADSWPVKVGMTDGGQSAAVRVHQQTSSTQVCERPVLVFEIKCKSARSMETSLHTMLSARGLKKEDAPGDEWYLSNPEEIRSLCEQIMGRPSE